MSKSILPDFVLDRKWFRIIAPVTYAPPDSAKRRVEGLLVRLVPDRDLVILAEQGRLKVHTQATKARAGRLRSREFRYWLLPDADPSEVLNALLEIAQTTARRSVQARRTYAEDSYVYGAANTARRVIPYGSISYEPAKPSSVRERYYGGIWFEPAPEIQRPYIVGFNVVEPHHSGPVWGAKRERRFSTLDEALAFRAAGLSKIKKLDISDLQEHAAAQLIEANIAAHLDGG